MESVGEKNDLTRLEISKTIIVCKVKIYFGSNYYKYHSSITKCIFLIYLQFSLSTLLQLHVNEEAKTKGLGAVMLRHKIGMNLFNFILSGHLSDLFCNLFCTIWTVPRFKKKEISNKARKRQERPKRNSQKSYTSLIIKSQDEIKSSCWLLRFVLLAPS